MRAKCDPEGTFSFSLMEAFDKPTSIHENYKFRYL